MKPRLPQADVAVEGDEEVAEVNKPVRMLLQAAPGSAARVADSRAALPASRPAPIASSSSSMGSSMPRTFASKRILWSPMPR